MLINFPATLLIALAGQAALIPMELPRLPDYTLTMSISCGSHKYFVAVENRGFIAKVISSRSNGKPVLFKTAIGTNLVDLIAEMHSVSVQPSSCRADEGVNLSIRGVDMRAQSKTRGTETIAFVGSTPEN